MAPESVPLLGGPVLSFAEQLTKLLITNPQKALQGEETSFGADALKTARMITPFANLWYAKAITNHLILQQLQEMANPGYNDRVRGPRATGVRHNELVGTGCYCAT